MTVVRVEALVTTFLLRLNTKGGHARVLSELPLIKRLLIFTVQYLFYSSSLSLSGGSGMLSLIWKERMCQISPI